MELLYFFAAAIVCWVFHKALVGYGQENYEEGYFKGSLNGASNFDVVYNKLLEEKRLEEKRLEEEKHQRNEQEKDQEKK